MTAYKRFSPNLISGFWVVVMIALWLAFAPTQAGGRASYIIVIGNSMEPNFHIGDLVIVHEEAGYQIGDAVVYLNRELENFVFHRIIAEDMRRFTLQGDNNAWTDTYQPTREEVIGKLWLHIPKGGNIIQTIRNPGTMALIAGALGVYLALGFFSGRSKGRKQMKEDRFTSIKHYFRDVFRPAPANPSPSNQSRLLEGAFFALGLVAFASFIIAIVSFSRSAYRTVRDNIGYDQLGFFAYAASAPQGVYDANAVKSGDPIFPKLTCVVDMTFQYTLAAVQAEDITGAYQLTATISEPNSGWQRTVALQEEGSFSGNAFGVNAQLDVCKMEKLAQSMELGTDFHPGSYILTVSPNIKVSGEIAGRTLDGTFDPSLTFRYDRVHFYLLKDEEQNGNVLKVSESGTLGEERLEANILRILGRDFAIPALRTIAVLGLVVSLGGLAYLGTRLQNLSKNDPVQFIRTRFDTQMIDIRNAAMLDANSCVDVSSMDDLGKLAERFHAMILHAEFDQSHTYYMQGEGTTYRFVIGSSKAESTVPAEEAGSKL